MSQPTRLYNHLQEIARGRGIRGPAELYRFLVKAGVDINLTSLHGMWNDQTRLFADANRMAQAAAALGVSYGDLVNETP